MNTAFSLRLIAIAVTAVFGLASPVFASKHENHPEKHAEQSHNSNENHSETHTEQGHNNNENHSETHTDQGHNSDQNHAENHGGSAVLKTTLTGIIEPGAKGTVKLKSKSRGTQFEVELKIPVPSTALAVANTLASQDATLVLSLSRAGVPYAECDFDWTSAKRGKAGYKIKIFNRGGVIQERAGLCDIDLATAGAQSGIPAIQAGDSAVVTIDTNHAAFLEGTF